MTAVGAAGDEPLMDWSPWEKYRGTVDHPAGYINAQDLENARENIERYQWAAQYAEALDEQAAQVVDLFTEEFLEEMVPETTPFPCYQCPACRDKGMSQHPGGSWSWSLDNPDVVTCRNCGTVFPNEDYPESIELRATCEKGQGQVFTFYEGETFKQWGYSHYRPNFTGEVRDRKQSFCKTNAYRLARAYALTGKLEYAEAVRRILLRFAEVYPNWLVISKYGEIADLDPHVAGLCLRDLPEDELVYPPNKPDRKLYAPYWATCRAGGGGMEGLNFTYYMLQAYEFTRNASRADGTPLYSEDEQIKIERDLLLESCIHLFGEKRINNKSVGNRIATAMVGIALAHPGFVRFGLEGWDLTMNEWFLEDGCTPESPAYALMSLGGIYKLPQAIRGYSDPRGYADAQGERIEALDLYEGKYQLVWQRMFEGLQGDLKYPPYADSYRSSALGARFAELLADNYPDNGQYLALLKEYAGEDLSDCHEETALFFREPGLEEKQAPPLHFEDNFFPILCLGQVRTGEHGRESLALLSATHGGGHHHYDSLNLYYWKNGHELLTDLGYLWDHPKKKMTTRTFAHNTGMLDLSGQRRDGRGGQFRLFHTGPQVKVMEASSQAYSQADVYRRTVVQVEHEAGSYLADIFRMQAPDSRDLVYHGPNDDYQVSGIGLVDGDLHEDQNDDIPFGLRFHCTGEDDVIYVDDVSIVLDDGTQLATNPSAKEIDPETGRPAGWNHYDGAGAAEWGAADPGRDDNACACMKNLGKEGDNSVNQALIMGDTDGFTGQNAPTMPETATGTVSFWIRGDAGSCNVGMVRWPNDPTRPGDRDHTTFGSVPVTDEWTHHELQFKLGQQIHLENVRSARSPDIWTARWAVDDDYAFAAHHCGQPGEVTYIGDGWGQRDHRDTDKGVTIPYIIRRHRPNEGTSSFCTVYEGYSSGQRTVESISRLAIPAAESDNIVGLRVNTESRTDIILSQLEGTDIALDTTMGEITTDAKVAVVSFSGDDVISAAIVEGDRLSLDGSQFEAVPLKMDPELPAQAQASSDDR